MKKLNYIAILPLLFGMSMGTAQAVQISVDMISGGGGDSSFTTEVGTSFTLDIVIDDTTDFAGFEFDLGFSSSVLTATGITSGNIFGLDTFGLDNQINANSIGFAESSLAFSGLDINVPTILASISFDVVGMGIESLDLSSVVFSDSFGEAISPVSLNNGSVAVVPVPGAIWLMAAGFSLLGWRRKRSKHDA